MNARRIILCAAHRTGQARLEVLQRELLAECARAGLDAAEVGFIRLRLTRPKTRQP